MPRRATKRKNLFGWGKATRPANTTPARGGIAAHTAGRTERTRKTTSGTALPGGVYKGYALKRTSDGDWYSSLDPSSWFDTKAQVQRHIDWYLKNRSNPGVNATTTKHEREIRAYVAQKAAIGWSAEQIYRAIWRRWGYLGEGNGGTVRVKMSGGYESFKVNPGKGNPAKKSKGHLFFLDGYEWYKAGGEVYRAPVDAVFENGYRNGRWEFPEWQIAGRKTKGVYPFEKRNPAAAAVEAYKNFHGHEPEETVTIKKRVHSHDNLAGAGLLKQLVVNGIDGRVHVIRGFKGALLAFSEDGNQLFIEGGDQSINLSDFGIKSPHEIETLGTVKHIDYFTRKDHLGDEGGEAVYTHQFTTTNERGKHVRVRIARYPDLIYRVRDQQLEFSGGSYEIRAEGIDK